MCCKSRQFSCATKKIVTIFCMEKAGTPAHFEGTKRMTARSIQKPAPSIALQCSA